jgi:hypothetical protein
LTCQAVGQSVYIRGLWYQLNVFADSCVSVSAKGIGLGAFNETFRPAVAVYTGSCAADLACMGYYLESDLPVIFSAASNTSYYLLLLGVDGDYGRFELNLNVRFNKQNRIDFTLSDLTRFVWVHRKRSLKQLVPDLARTPFQVKHCDGLLGLSN